MLVVGSDHGGYELKTAILQLLQEKAIEYTDLGTDGPASVDYPDFAHKCAHAVIADKGSFGILICGTGIGISISANKVEGIRAALCHDAYTATMSRAHNNANILAFGERVVGKGVTESIIDAFCSTEFEGGRHADRVSKIETGCSFGSNLG